MKYDIAVVFISSLGKVAGFLNPNPIEGTEAQAEEMRTSLQANMTKLNHLSVFTRDTAKIYNSVMGAGDILGSEVTLPGDLIKQSFMQTQIILYED